MDRDLEVLTALLLDPCLTADEALREAHARRNLRDIEKTNPNPGGHAEAIAPREPR